MRSLGTAHLPTSPPLTACVLLASPVDRQHVQRVEDGAVGAHCAGVPMPRGGKAAVRTPQAAVGGGGGRPWGSHSPPAPQQQRLILRDVVGQQVRDAPFLGETEGAGEHSSPPCLLLSQHTGRGGGICPQFPPREPAVPPSPVPPLGQETVVPWGPRSEGARGGLGCQGWGGGGLGDRGSFKEQPEPRWVLGALGGEVKTEQG